MQGAVIITLGGPEGVQITPAPALPVAKVMLGKPVAEALALLPRLFALCAHAQSAAFHLALGLPPPDHTLSREIMRDHLLKLCVIWPRLLGLPTQPIPQTDAALRDLDFGPLFGALRETFAPGEACTTLPLVTPETAMQGGALENSVAARQAAHPDLRQIEATYGRGPLWHATARKVDLLACLSGTLPAPQRLPDGTALAPAARGLFAIRAQADQGRITAFARHTPTDHLCAPNGALHQSLHNLPAAKAGLAPLVIDILSPCVPHQLQQVQHA